MESILPLLSPKEAELLHCLEGVTSNSYWGHGIRFFLTEHQTLPEFLQLIKDLKQAAADDAEILRDILPEPCFTKLINF